MNRFSSINPITIAISFCIGCIFYYFLVSYTVDFLLIPAGFDIYLTVNQIIVISFIITCLKSSVKERLSDSELRKKMLLTEEGKKTITMNNIQFIGGGILRIIVQFAFIYLLHLILF